jgi:hypothetical protein
MKLIREVSPCYIYYKDFFDIQVRNYYSLTMNK